MVSVILFGGTTEGRLLAEFLKERGVRALLCVATEYGQQLEESATLSIHAGRLDAKQMEELFTQYAPRLVIDATHPFATLVSQNLQIACAALRLRYLRVLREQSRPPDGCCCVDSMEHMVKLLNESDQIIFSTLGTKSASTLTQVRDFARRIYLRILPDPEGLAACVALGYPKSHLICMQGPFSPKLNSALFAETGAEILLTKQSGEAGGFSAKIQAAKECRMRTMLLLRPQEQGGVTLPEAFSIIEEELL